MRTIALVRIVIFLWLATLAMLALSRWLRPGQINSPLWMSFEALFGGALLATLVVVISVAITRDARDYRTRRRNATGVCPTCHAVFPPPRPAQCPTCAVPLVSLLPFTPAEPVRLCSRCRYSLRGLPTSICPECGHDTASDNVQQNMT